MCVVEFHRNALEEFYEHIACTNIVLYGFILNETLGFHQLMD